MSKVVRASRTATNVKKFRKSRVFRVSRLVIMVSTYRYKPLPDGESIRVLVLNPGKDGDPLTGTLEVIHLHRQTPNCDSTQDTQSSETGVTRWTPEIPYEAISYVWGSDTKDHVIFLSGKTHRITNNLSVSLHQCRLSDQSRALWADSICIDQDRLDEKGHQVYMMGRIYASSQRTLICLGYGYQNDARDASALTDDVNKMIQETFHSPGFSWKLNCFPWPLPGDPLVNDSRWQSIEVLFHHPWFSRGWVVQEVALGREANILWSDCKLTFSDLMRADTWYLQRPNQQLEKQDRKVWPPILLQQVWHHRQKAEARVFFSSERFTEDYDILYVLHHARVVGLRDPRDRIFAFMALPFVRSPVPVLHPDYMQARQELYQDFAIKYLEETSDLNLLSHASRNSQNESFDGSFGNSWVPRWDRHHWSYDHDGSHVEVRNFGQVQTESAEFVVLGENGASASLQVRGVIFDSIRLVSPFFDASMTIQDLTTVWSHWSKQIGIGTDSRQDQPSSDYESLAFLIALAHGRWAGAIEEEWTEALKSYSRFLWNSAQDSESSRSPQVSPDIQLCHRHLMVLAEHLHVFSLKRGYYGLASPEIRQDDVCAFIFGVRGPIILRRVPEAGTNHYIVIGPAYVVSKRLSRLGVPLGLDRWDDWVDWNEVRENEGWTDWGLKEETIILL